MTLRRTEQLSGASNCLIGSSRSRASGVLDPLRSRASSFGRISFMKTDPPNDPWPAGANFDAYFGPWDDGNGPPAGNPPFITDGVNAKVDIDQVLGEVVNMV